jgi:hypothetical protein
MIRRKFMLAAIVAALVMPGAVASAASPSGTQTFREPLPADVCAANMKITGRPARDVCYQTTTVTTSGSVGGVQAAVVCSIPSGYTHCGWVQTTTQSLLFGVFWSETTRAGFVSNNSSGKVRWEWVTCTKNGIGFSLEITWCGKYSSGAYYLYTNAGANFTVSVLYHGAPIYASHGNRISFNPFTLTYCCIQQW